MHDLIIVGGGLSGLTAALNATKLGLRVRLFEANNRLGGQILSHTVSLDDNDEYTADIELGAEFFDINRNPKILKYLQYYNIPITPIVEKNILDISDNNNNNNNNSNSNNKKVQKSKIFWKFLHNKSIVNDDDLFNTLKTSSDYQKVVQLISSDVQTVTFLCSSTSMNWADDYSNCGVKYPQYIKIKEDLGSIPHRESKYDISLDYFDIPYSEYIKDRLNLDEELILYEFVLSRCFYLCGGDPTQVSAVSILRLIGWLGSVEEAFHSYKTLYRVQKGGLSSLIEKMREDIVSRGGEIHLNQPVLSVSLSHEERIIDKVPKYDYVEENPLIPIVAVKLKSGEIFSSKSIIISTPLKCIPSICFNPPLPRSISIAAEKCGAININKQFVKVYCKALLLSPEQMLSKRVQYYYSYSSSCKHTSLTSLKAYPNNNNNNNNNSYLDIPESIIPVFGFKEDLNNINKIENALKSSVFPNIQLDRSPSLNHNNNYNINYISTNHCEYDNNIIYEDFTGSPWSRGSWFVIKKGTASLHYEAYKDSKTIWLSNEDIDKQSPMIIACSELSVKWTGWLEGGIIMAEEAVDKFYKSLCPKKIERNFVKFQRK